MRPISPSMVSCPVPVYAGDGGDRYATIRANLSPGGQCLSQILPKKIFAISVLCAGLFAAACKPASQPADNPKIDPNRYYAVLLNNGAVYFGKLEGLGTSYPTLRDVFYIQSSVDPQTKATSNVLVKRGKELHGPDMMILNEKSIVFVEPVGAQSKVAELIQESQKQ